MADVPIRETVTKTVTTVRYVAHAFGRTRSNPPSLGQLRAFVSMCEDMPDDTSVRLDKSSLDESGRYSLTLDLRVEVDP